MTFKQLKIMGLREAVGMTTGSAVLLYFLRDIATKHCGFIKDRSIFNKTNNLPLLRNTVTQREDSFFHDISQKWQY